MHACLLACLIARLLNRCCATVLTKATCLVAVRLPPRRPSGFSRGTLPPRRHGLMRAVQDLVEMHSPLVFGSIAGLDVSGALAVSFPLLFELIDGMALLAFVARPGAAAAVFFGLELCVGMFLVDLGALSVAGLLVQGFVDACPLVWAEPSAPSGVAASVKLVKIMSCPGEGRRGSLTAAALQRCGAVRGRGGARLRQRCCVPKRLRD